MEASDQILLNEFLRGKEQAFRVLSERHMNLVYGVAMRNLLDPALAEEVVQDVFILLAKKARKLASHPCIAGWLHTTSRNVARDARRKRLGHQRKLARFAAEAPPAEAPSSSDDLEEIDTAVRSLPPNERDAILLRFFEDRDYREIADHLSISEPAARKRVSRGIQRLHSGLQAKLAAGTALAIVAPGHLNQVVASSLAPTASSTLATSAGTTISKIIMTKSTASIGCAALVFGTLSYVAYDQSSKRKDLEAELSGVRQELAELRDRSGVASEKPPLSAVGDFPNNPIASEQKKRIRALEEELTTEKSKRLLAEEDAAAVREATAALEDEVVLSYGKVEEIGNDFGSIFKEARALMEIEKAGQLDTDENEKRLIRFSMKAASITGLSKQIIEFDNQPEEGSRFFSSTYKSIFDLDDKTTANLQRVFAEQIAAAKERDLTLVNNPGLKMLEGDESITEQDIKSWLSERQSFYAGVRQRLREQIPADKQAEFDRTIEQDGIGFTNLTLKGSPLAFSLGGRQGSPDKDAADE